MENKSDLALSQIGQEMSNDRRELSESNSKLVEENKQLCDRVERLRNELRIVDQRNSNVINLIPTC